MKISKGNDDTKVVKGERTVQKSYDPVIQNTTLVKLTRSKVKMHPK